jgi:hypothetical protein
MERNGNNLVFVISQPRSGSTLLQHILGSHSNIHTLPEPWIMLHPIYALRKQGIQSEFNTDIARIALEGFLDRTDKDHTKYRNGIRDFLLGMYENALENTGKEYFLDKTPRYYFIIDEILEIFPASKIILLVRNPAAVAASMLNANFSGNWERLFKPDRKHDLVTAPRLILDAKEKYKDRLAFVRYENLVTRPEEAIEKICNYLSVPFEKGIMDYNEKVRFTGTTFVDPKSIYRHKAPVKDYVDAWKDSFNTRQQVKIVSGFINELGSETIDSLGYSSEQINEALQNIAKSKWGLTISFDRITSPDTEMKPIDKMKIRVAKKLERITL